MSPALWLSIAALLLPRIRAHPVAAGLASCKEFGQGVSLDPHRALGTWTTVYAWTGTVGNVTESIIVEELFPSQLVQYEDILKEFPESASKFSIVLRDTNPIRLDVSSILVIQDNSIYLDGWVTYIKLMREELSIPHPTHFRMKWIIMEGFLVMMLCDTNKIYVASRTSLPDEDKLMKVVEELNVQGKVGGRIYPSSAVSFL